MNGMNPYKRRIRSLRNDDREFMDPTRLLESFFSNSWPGSYGNHPMKVDIREEEGAYLLDADLPGVSKDQVLIAVEDDMLSIQVNQNEQTEKQEENYIRRERRSATFCRSFNLEGIDRDQIKASMADGVLHVVLPKMAEPKTKSRPIPIE